MIFIRPFVNRDIPQVAELYQEIFLMGEEQDPGALRDYFADMFFGNPWLDEELPSLVAVNVEGRVIGFLGVIPRRMRWRGEKIRMVVSLHYMVAPGSRSSLAGIELLRALFAGPQDLTLTDGAGDLGRKIWHGLGGSTALYYSLEWLCILRPVSFALAHLARRGGWQRIAAALADPLCGGGDYVARRLLPHHFRRPKPMLIEETLLPATLAGCGWQRGSNGALEPCYDEPSLAWLLARIPLLAVEGSIEQAALRDERGRLRGWFIYHLKPGGTSQVVQLAAEQSALSDVLDHLFHHAWQRGASALSGRLDPRHVEQLTLRRCLINCGSPWTLVHSRRAELLQAVALGDAVLSRLEGDLCFRFGAGRAQR